MDCPNCGHEKSKVVSTEKWSNHDTRKHRCLKCKWEWQSLAMPVAFDALLEAAALVTKEHHKLLQEGRE